MSDDSKRPFDPEGGKFAENIRNLTGDDSELRESLQRAGWIEHLPAFSDENDVIIVGHRRLKIAAELKIKPVIRKLTFGKGDAGDTKRLQLAIASNTGGKGLTQGDRKRITEYLYIKQNWTMQAIADAMNVSKMTISNDLSDCKEPLQSKHDKTASNPKGAGRPKGRKGRPYKSEQSKTGAAASLFLDQGWTRERVVTQTGLGEHEVQLAIERERGRRDPQIDRNELSQTAQQKLDAAIRQHQAKLDASFRVKVEDEIRRRIDEIVLPHWKQKIEQ